jgi:hypothetical protein
MIIENETKKYVAPFNGPIEIGLRALTVLSEAFPTAFSLQRLIIFDYLLVHSDDLPNGPAGLHPKTPNRSGELLIRRKVLEEGLRLYQSRGLIESKFTETGIFYIATDYSAAFLDSLCVQYSALLRERATWVVEKFKEITDATLEQIVRARVNEWGAEFALESVLWLEDNQ